MTFLGENGPKTFWILVVLPNAHGLRTFSLGRKILHVPNRDGTMDEFSFVLRKQRHDRDRQWFGRSSVDEGSTNIVAGKERSHLWYFPPIHLRYRKHSHVPRQKLSAEAQTRLSQRSAAWQPWRAFVALFALFTLGTVTWLSNVTSRWHFKLYCSHFLSPCQEVAADFGIMKDGTIAVTFALVTTSLKPPMTGLQEPYRYLSEKKTLYPQCPLQFPVYAHYGGFPHFSLELNSPKSCMNLPPYKCGNNDVRGKYSFWYKFSRTSLDTPIFVVKFSKIYVWSKELMRASALIHKNRKFPVAIIFLSSQ